MWTRKKNAEIDSEERIYPGKIIYTQNFPELLDTPLRDIFKLTKWAEEKTGINEFHTEQFDWDDPDWECYFDEDEDNCIE